MLSGVCWCSWPWCLDVFGADPLFSYRGESYGSLAGTEQVERETGSLGIPQLCTITEDLYRLFTKEKSF